MPFGTDHIHALKEGVHLRIANKKVDNNPSKDIIVFLDICDCSSLNYTIFTKINEFNFIYFINFF